MNTNETQSWYKSKTIAGGIINLLVFISLMFSFGLDESILGALVQGVFGLIGTVMVIYGRVKARKVIK